ncbi:MAG: pilin [Parcubacteria group bacterium]|jgi:hypothetical protein
MTKRTNLFISFLGAIFFSFIFVAASAEAGCQSPNMTCNGTIVRNPGVENTCVSDEVWCEPKAASSFPGTQGIGYTCEQDSDCASNNCENTVCASSSTNTKKVGDICASSDECPEGSICLAESGSANNLKTCKLTPGGGVPPAQTPTPGGGAATGNGWSLGSISGFGLPSGSILGIISGILTWLLGALGIFGVIGFVISGIMYLVSTGDEGMIEKAKEAMKYSIMGVIVGLIGVVIIQAIDWMLRGFSNF